jgi:hypothetical protein
MVEDGADRRVGREHKTSPFDAAKTGCRSDCGFGAGGFASVVLSKE